MAAAASGDPVLGALNDVVNARLHDVALSTGAREVLDRRLRGMASEARRAYQHGDSFDEPGFRAALERLAGRIDDQVVSYVADLRTRGVDSVVHEVDVDELRREMGVICPTPPFCEA
jgi:hypothetical protein